MLKEIYIILSALVGFVMVFSVYDFWSGADYPSLYNPKNVRKYFPWYIDIFIFIIALLIQAHLYQLIKFADLKRITNENLKYVVSIPKDWTIKENVDYYDVDFPMFKTRNNILYTSPDDKCEILVTDSDNIYKPSTSFIKKDIVNDKFKFTIYIKDSPYSRQSLYAESKDQNIIIFAKCNLPDFNTILEKIEDINYK